MDCLKFNWNNWNWNKLPLFFHLKGCNTMTYGIALPTAIRR